MDFDRLRSFVRVAEVGSLSGASDVLRIAQPALSRQIRILEAEVGQKLFLRSHAGMRLTPAGTELLSRVAGLLRQLEQSIDEVRAFGEDPSGAVTIGIVPTVAAVVAEPLILRVARELPRVRLQLTEGYTGHILDWLHHREVDIGVLYGPAIDLHLRTRVLARDELVLIAPPGTALGAAADLAADLAGHPLILPRAPHGLRLVVDKAAEQAGITLEVAAEVSSYSTTLRLVAAGIARTVLPRSILPESGGPEFAVRAFTPALVRQVVQAEPPGPPATRAIDRVAEILVEETARLLA